jgi:hypothetical protein
VTPYFVVKSALTPVLWLRCEYPPWVKKRTWRL